MISQDTVRQLQHAPMTDRIRVIEVLLQSLKYDIASQEPRQVIRQPFMVHTFNLGKDIHMDREAMYAERGC